MMPAARCGPEVPEHHAQRTTGDLSLNQFVLRLRIEVAGIMALVQLPGWLAHGPIDHPTAFDGGPLRDCLCPANDVHVVPPLQELARFVLCAERQSAVPGPD